LTENPTIPILARAAKDLPETKIREKMDYLRIFDELVGQGRNFSANLRTN
jgi:hypothetical protein